MLLEFLDKVLCCKSEDIVTPGPVIDYSYNGKIHKWIMDVYYIPYNLCIDVKDGGIKGIFLDRYIFYEEYPTSMYV